MCEKRRIAYVFPTSRRAHTDSGSDIVRPTFLRIGKSDYCGGDKIQSQIQTCKDICPEAEIVAGICLLKEVRIIAAAALFLFVIPVGLWLLGKRLDPFLFPSLSLEPIHLLGIPILLAGLAIGVTSIWQLHRFGSGMPWGDVADDAQSSRLVTRGLYSYSRNPMLFGFGLFVLGMGLYCGSCTTAFVFSSLVVALVSAWIRKLEEPKLVERFGQEYIAYRERTPFLVPRPPRKG